MYATHNDVFAEQGMDNPERRTQEGYILDEHSVTFVDIDELRAQTILGSESALFHIYAILCILQQACTRTHILTDFSRFPTICVLATPFPPSGILAAAIDSSLASDGNIFLLVGIDARLQVVAVKTFPTSRDDRIEFGLEHKLQHAALLNVEVDLALECDGTSIECAFWHYHTSASSLRTGINSFVDSLLVGGSSSLGACAILSDVEHFVAKLRLANALFYLLVLGVPTIGKSHGGQ